MRRIASVVRRDSVRSCTSISVPVLRPASRTGDSVSSTSRGSPSAPRSWNSYWLGTASDHMREAISATNWSTCADGTTSATVVPTISSALFPNSARSAAFVSSTRPSVATSMMPLRAVSRAARKRSSLSRSARSLSRRSP